MAKRTAASGPTPRKRTAAKKPNGAGHEPAGGPPGPSDDEIRVRAYQRYLERGGVPGGDFDDWVEAEKDLKATQS